MNQEQLYQWMETLQLRIQSGKWQRWMKWVLATAVTAGERVYLLVDETPLSDNLSTMVVGPAYQRRCIGLTWRSYWPDAWPCGQVELIGELLRRVKAVVDPAQEVMVEVDRGIGTSPDLVQVVLDLGVELSVSRAGSDPLSRSRPGGV